MIVIQYPYRTLFIFLPVLLFAACSQDYSPKPRGYMRIELPQRDYIRFDLDYPYSFEHANYSVMEPDTRATAEDYWADIYYPQFRARIHMSYKTVENTEQLQGHFNDARTFVTRHIPKASAIRDEMIVNEKANVYGVLYQIRGREAATALQFYATDSLRHFLRGALYFNVRTNNDSLSPVIEHIEEDIRHLFSTLEWE